MRQPLSPKTSPVDLPDAAAAELERYAAERGITVDQAATQLAQQVLNSRYRIARVPGARVVPLRRR